MSVERFLGLPWPLRKAALEGGAGVLAKKGLATAPAAPGLVQEDEEWLGAGALKEASSLAGPGAPRQPR